MPVCGTHLYDCPPPPPHTHKKKTKKGKNHSIPWWLHLIKVSWKPKNTTFFINKRQGTLDCCYLTAVSSERMDCKCASLSWKRLSLLKFCSNAYEDRNSRLAGRSWWTRALHSGQLEWDWNYVSMQVTWKPWEQFGRCFSHSPSSNSPRQMAQSVLIGLRSPSFFLIWCMGRECTTENSKPRLWGCREGSSVMDSSRSRVWTWFLEVLARFILRKANRGWNIM